MVWQASLTDAGKVMGGDRPALYHKKPQAVQFLCQCWCALVDDRVAAVCCRLWGGSPDVGAFLSTGEGRQCTC